MKNVSEKYLEKMQDGLRTFVPRMSIDGVELDGDIQSGLTINLGSCGTEQFSIGNAFIPYITASIAECSTMLQDKEILLEMGLILADGTTEYAKMGYFTVEKPETDKFQTSFTAYGRLMSKAGGIFQNNLTYPTSIQSVLDEVRSQTGLTIKLNGLTAEGQIEKPIIGELNREVLMRIAGLLGGFVTEDGDGNIIISKYALNRSVTVDMDFCYIYPETNDTKYTVTGIEVLIREDGTDEEGNTIPGEKYTSDSVVNVAVQNPYMTESLFETCESNVVGFSYMPAKVEFLGDISLEPWDSIVVTDEDPDAGIDIPCMSIVHTWDGGLVTTVTAPGTTATEDSSSFGGPLTTMVERTYQKVLIAEQVIAAKVTAEYVEANYASIKSLEATNATIETLRSKAITTENLTAKVAELGYLKAAEAELKYATITSLNALNASVTDLSAIAITTNNISAKVADLGYLLASEAELKYATVEELEADIAEINSAKIGIADVETLLSEKAYLTKVEAEELYAGSADFNELKANAITTTTLDSKVSDLGYAKVDIVEAANARIDDLYAEHTYLKEATAEKITAIEADLNHITSNYLEVDIAEARYVTTEYLESNYLKATTIASTYVTTDNLYADFMTAERINATFATLDGLNSEVGRIDKLFSDYATIEMINTDYLTADQIRSDYAKIEQVNTEIARIDNLFADYVKITDLEAEYIKAAAIEAKYATIANLKVANANITSLQSTVADIEKAYMDEAEVETLIASKGYLNEAQVNTLIVDKGYFTEAQVETLVAGKGYITTTETETLLADYATVAQLNTSNANISALQTKVAEIDKAYMTEAEVDTLVVSKGYLTEAQVNTLVVNKGYLTEAQVNTLIVSKGYLVEAEVETLITKKGYFTEAQVENLVVGKGYITTTETKTLLADYATVTSLNSANANISSLQSDVATIKDAYISTASVNSLLANYVKTSVLEANYTKTTDLEATYATIKSLNAEIADVEKLFADYVKTATLEADYITASKISSTYATITNLNAATARIGTLETTTVKASELEATVGTFGYLKAANLSAEVAKLGYATVSSLEAVDAKFGTLSSTYATVDLANVKDGSITTAMIGTGVVGTAQIADGSVTNAKIVELTANKITAGTLSVERLEIRGSNTSLVYALNNITGALQSQNVNTLNGEILTDRTLTADKIVANAITANEIASRTITANKIAAGTITATEIKSSTITADKLSVSTLSAITANLGTVTAGILMSTNYKESDYSVDSSGNVTGSVLSGLKIDLDNMAYYTPQVTIKDNFILVNGFASIGGRNAEGTVGAHTLSIGSQNIASGDFSITSGFGNTTSGRMSATFGRQNIASGGEAVAIGFGSTASGDWSCAGGYVSKAIANGAYAYGFGCEATGFWAHAEGYGTVASGDVSHAEGQETVASGEACHAEGRNSTAADLCSHAEGEGTIARYGQHAQGRYNIEDYHGIYIHVVGNGLSDTSRSNAHTLDRYGNAWYAGNVTAVSFIGSLSGNAASATTLSGLTATIAELNYMDGVTSNVQSQLNAKAAKENSVYYIEGTGDTAGTWLGSHDDIAEYYDGLTIAYKVGVAGVSDGTTLNINNLGAIAVMRNASSAVTTHYGVGSVVILTYTTDDGTGYWKIADYDANNYAYVRQYYTTTNANYPLLFKYDAGITTTSSYVTKYSRYGNSLYVNPSTGTIYATTFSGALSGNAATATKLETARTISLSGSVTGSGTFDGSGNLSITTTTNHTHSYLPLSGGTLTGELVVSSGGATITGGLKLKGSVNSAVLVTPSIYGSDSDGNLSDLYIQNLSAGKTYFGGKTYYISSNGSAYNGNAATATKLETARTISLTGSVTGSGTFDGSGNLSITTTTNHTHTVSQISDLTATAAELNYCDGVTSNIQTQLNGKAATHSHPYLSNQPTCIELNSTGGLANYGGFIDFHYNGSTADYTSRIIENASGTLSINNVTITTGKVVTATTFVGALSGNATSASTAATCSGNAATATNATNDKNGREISRFYCSMIPAGTAIGSDANLNTTDYLKIGNYYCSSNATAATLTNCPLSVAFSMQVYNPLSTTVDNETTGTWVYRLRKITAYNTGVQYMQYCYAGATANSWTYGDWYVVPRSKFTMDTADTNGGSATIGGSTKPVYVSSDGTLTACSAYAGGTAVTLNGSSKAASTASFYAPTSAGTSGYLLASNGSGAPSWISTLGHSASRTGVIKLGKFCIEFGTVSITTGTTAAQEVYTGSATITFSNTFLYAPAIFTDWSGRYDNMKTTGATSATTTGATIWGKTSTSEATRSIAWIAIGCIA